MKFIRLVSFLSKCLICLHLFLTVISCRLLEGQASAVVRPLISKIEKGEHKWKTAEHHNPEGGFLNPGGEFLEPPPFSRAFPWMISRLFIEKENPGIPVHDLALKDIREEDNRYRATWLGHSSVLIEYGKLAIITDPIFSNRASPVTFLGPGRLAALPMEPESLPAIDIVVISHNHYDHLDEASVRKLKALFDPLFLVPSGVGDNLSEMNIQKVVELDWGEYVEYEGAKFHAVPARHFSARSMMDRNETLWAGWIMDMPYEGPRLYFAGDTGYGAFAKEIADHFPGIDLAMIPVGAYKPRWLMSKIHVNPEEAIQLFKDVGAKRMLAIHHSTFDLAEEPVLEPSYETIRLSKEMGIRNQVHVILPGDMIALKEVRLVSR